MFQIKALEMRSQRIRILEFNDGIQEVQSVAIEVRDAWRSNICLKKNQIRSEK